MTGQTLMSSADARAAHPNPPATAPDHSKMLNAAEQRVLAEFIDLGGKYFNDPFDPAANVRTLNGLSKTTFEKDVLPILTTTCAAACHQAIGSSMSDTPIGTNFRNNRFVLTGDAEGRLRSDPVDDLQRMQRGFELPAEQAVDGAASVDPARPADTAVLADRQRELQHHCQLDIHGLLTLMIVLRRTTLSIALLGTLAACGGSSNPLGNPPVVSNPHNDPGQPAPLLRVLPEVHRPDLPGSAAEPG